jgi:hypothetical protein
VVGGDRCEAPAADPRDTGALGLDTAAGLGVIGRFHQVLVTGPHLERDGALTRLGDELADVEAKADLLSDTEPVETGSRQDNRIEAALSHLAKACVHVPAQWFDGQFGLEGEELGLPTHGSRPDSHAGAQRVGAAEGVARIIAGQVGADGEVVRECGRHVLRRVNGEVDATGEERLLDLLDEDAPLADLAERLRPVTVAGGRDRNECHVHVGIGFAQTFGCSFRLRQREATAP